MEKKLYRNPNNRLLGGVCSGLGQYFDIDITLVRLAWIVLFFATSGLIPVLYGIMWAIIPKEPVMYIEGSPANQPPVTNNSSGSGCLGLFLKITFALIILFVLFLVGTLILSIFLIGIAFISNIFNGSFTIHTIETFL